MAYEKVYSRINWENEPSTKSPINEENLNKMDYALNEIDNRTVELSGYESIVIEYAGQAQTSAINALSSETKAKTSEQNAYSYEQSAFASKNQAEGFKNEAETHASNASDSERNAKASEDNASASELLAKQSEENASEYASSASRSSENASGFASSAEISAQNAKDSEDIAVASASSAKTDSDLARSYTVGTHGEVRENDDTDNAKYYYEQTKGLVAGSVTGVKGEAEEEFRDGNVIITKENLGLGNVENKSVQEIISEIGNATDSSDGLMSKEDKVKLDGIEDIKLIYDFETEAQATTGEALTDGKLHIVDDGEDFGEIPIDASMIPYRDNKSVADGLSEVSSDLSELGNTVEKMQSDEWLNSQALELSTVYRDFVLSKSLDEFRKITLRVWQTYNDTNYCTTITIPVKDLTLSEEWEFRYPMALVETSLVLKVKYLSKTKIQIGLVSNASIATNCAIYGYH